MENIEKENIEQRIWAIEQLNQKMAAELHNEWRESRRIEKSDKFEPRWKDAKDPEFSNKWMERLKSGEHPENIRFNSDGKIEIDIANTSYSELSHAWKAENKASAEAAIGVVTQAFIENRPLDEAFIEAASSYVHEKWLERNGAWDPPEQNKPYEELTEDEKEKDRLYVRKAIKLCQSQDKIS